MVLISGFSFLANQSFAQEVNKSKQTKPDVKIKVNKEFDDKGNVTRYDSTYSYSWSSNGQFSTNIDSLFMGFNHSFRVGGEFDSMLNNFGFDWPFGENDMFTQPFANHNKQLEEFFRNHQTPADSTFGGMNKESFTRDFWEMQQQHQKLMEEFFHQFKIHRDSLIINPNDTIPSKETPRGKIKPEKQNYFPRSKMTKTINV